MRYFEEDLMRKGIDGLDIRLDVYRGSGTAFGLAGSGFNVHRIWSCARKVLH